MTVEPNKATSRQSPVVPLSRSVYSWILYDFANTIFSMNIVSLYFSQWLIIDNGQSDLLYGVLYSFSMFFVMVSMPFLGAITDRTDTKSRFLNIFTLICIVTTVMLGVNHFVINAHGYRVGFACFLFIIANYSYGGGLTFYNSLLPVVSTKQNRGYISGWGVGVGYLGSILGMLMVKPFVELYGRGGAFIPTGVLFLIFALPVMFFVKDIPRVRASQKAVRAGKLVRETFRHLKQTISRLSDYPGVLRFLIAKILYEDPLNTLIVFMAVYMQSVMQFTDTEKVRVLIAFTVAAVVGSIISGKATDRFNPKRVLIFTVMGWTCCFFLLSMTFSRTVFWVLGCLMGMLLGSAWTSSRPLLLCLVPASQVGEFFGLYSLSGKVAAIIGPMIWGIIVNSLQYLGPMRYRIAIFFLGLLTLAGGILLIKVQVSTQYRQP